MRVIVGTTIGQLKDVRFEKKLSNRFHSGTTRPARCLFWAPGPESERYLVSAFADWTLELRDMLGGELVCTRRVVVGTGDLAAAALVAGAGPQVLLAAVDGTVSVFDWHVLFATGARHSSEAPAPLRTATIPGPLHALAVDEKGERFAAGGEENPLRVYATDTLEPLFVARVPKADPRLRMRRPVWISGVTFVPADPHRVAAVTKDREVLFYDLSSGQRRPVSELRDPDMLGCYLCVAAHPTKRLVFAGDSAGGVHVVSSESGKLVRKLARGPSSVRAIAVHPTEPYILTGGLARQVSVIHQDTALVPHRVWVKQEIDALLVSSEPLRKPKVKKTARAGRAKSDSDSDGSELERDAGDIWAGLASSGAIKSSANTTKTATKTATKTPKASMAAPKTDTPALKARVPVATATAAAGRDTVASRKRPREAVDSDDDSDDDNKRGAIRAGASASDDSEDDDDSDESDAGAKAARRARAVAALRAVTDAKKRKTTAVKPPPAKKRRLE